MSLSFETPTQLLLEISSSVQADSWQQSQQLSTPEGRWHAYLNQLCLQTFLSWWQEEGNLEEARLAAPACQPEIWELVNGVPIALGNTRLILLPTEAMDSSELRVPQEWVDIPEWSGDYYLAAQVNPDECWVRIWGYTTHQHLKTKASYHTDDRTYTLNDDALFLDLMVLWVVRQLNVELTRYALAPVLGLKTDEAEALLQRLEKLPICQWRLAMSFEIWAATVGFKEWRSRLYQIIQSKALACEQNPLQSSVPIAASVINLNQWFRKVFESDWQPLENVLANKVDLAYSLRKENIEEEQKRVKFVTLKSAAVEHHMLLLLTLTRETNDRVGVQVQLRPVPGKTYLPENVLLELLSIAGQPIQIIRSRRQDNYIQLKRLKCPPKWQFMIRVEHDGISFVESFIS